MNAVYGPGLTGMPLMIPVAGSIVRPNGNGLNAVLVDVHVSGSAPVPVSWNEYGGRRAYAGVYRMRRQLRAERQVDRNAVGNCFAAKQQSRAETCGKRVPEISDLRRRPRAD